jgi:anti-anti-sigma factor
MRFSLTRHHRDDGLVTLAPAGDVDIDAVDALGSAIQEALQTLDRTAVVVDLSRVTFLDCAGIGALVVGRNTAVSRGHRYTVINPQRQVCRVLELAGVFTALTGRRPQPARMTGRAARSPRSRRHHDDWRVAATPSSAGV